jgi:hypothetical protein
MKDRYMELILIQYQYFSSLLDLLNKAILYE